MEKRIKSWIKSWHL